MRAKESYKFQHEIKQTKETKIPKSKIEYKRLQPKAVGQAKETQTGGSGFTLGEAPVDSGYTLGQAPANTYQPSTFSPLVVQIPELVSPSIVSPYIPPIVTQSIETQTSPFGNPIIQEHPDFFKTFTGIQAYEKAQAEEAISKIEREKEQAVAEKDLTRDFIDTFMYSKFRVPIEMKEELGFILETAKKIELDDQGRIRKDSQYNSDIYRDLENWMNRAVQAGVQARTLKLSDWTRFLEDRALGARLKGKVSKKKKEKMKKLRMDLAQPELDRNDTQLTSEKLKEPKVSLQIDTNIPRLRGPRAPTRTTFPALNKANVSTANIISGARRR